ncbi:MAG: hypothetical protein FD153_104 [Rhodospirillaceae bacterium]|nr:MAG: hypothetical protein FD153_104 [Rhodospirillaceae bacterium]
MTSKVEICNLALLQIGEDTITNLHEKSKAARVCHVLYAPSRDAVLESFPWSFALQRQTLALLAESAPLPWAYAYQRPIDCLRSEEILPTRPDKPVLFAVEGDKVLTDQAGAVLLYVRSIDDPALFSAQFVQALSWYLAGKLAIPLTGDEAKARLCLQMYGAVVQEARTIQANQGHHLSQPLPPWIAARSRG